MAYRRPQTGNAVGASINKASANIKVYNTIYIYIWRVIAGGGLETASTDTSLGILSEANEPVEGLQRDYGGIRFVYIADIRTQILKSTMVVYTICNVKEGIIVPSQSSNLYLRVVSI